MKTKVTIVGFGIMGQAIAKALLKSDRRINIFTIDLHNIKEERALKNIENSDFVLLAVKPQDSREAILQVKNYLKPNTILISIMAGVPIKKLVVISGHRKIVRIMPNLGLSVGSGIAAWKPTGLSKTETEKAKNFIDKITDNFEVKNEDIINKVTAISGSGPAYFFLLADSLMKACENLGFKKEQGRKLVEKTFLAAALLSKDQEYSALVKKVASKGGTTEAALKIFQKEKFDKITLRAVSAAYKRAKGLGK
jgi:pyrroline-5-carboxylate reductase